MKRILHILLLTSYMPLFAQVSPVIWDKTYGGSGTDGFGDFSDQRLLEKRDGTGFYFGGASNSGMSGTKSEATRGDADYWVLNIGMNGALNWEKTYGGTNREGHPKLVEHSNGDLFWIGSSNSGISGDKAKDNTPSFTLQHYDFWIVKTDPLGNKLDEFVLGGSAFEAAFDGIETRDGNLLLLGQSSSQISNDVTLTGFGQKDIWLVKITPTGIILWEQRLGGDKDDIGLELLELPNGDIAIIGSTNSNISGTITDAPRGKLDIWVNCLNENGMLKWNHRFGTTADDQGVKLGLAQDGIILGGNSEGIAEMDKSGFNRGSLDYWILKVDFNGQLIWETTVGGNNFDELHDIYINCKGQILAGGVSFSPVSFEKTAPSIGSLDMWLVKLSAAGEVKWDYAQGGSGYDQLSSLREHPDGGLMLCGLSDSPISGDKSDPGFGSFDFWLSRIQVRAAFNSVDTICVGESIQFTNENTRIADDYYWDFGDPFSGAMNSSRVKNPVHVFSQPGIYSVSLTAEEGCDAHTQTRIIFVQPAPIPDFSFPQDYWVPNDIISFTNLTSGNPNFSWDFGDGNGTTTSSPNHSYSTDGDYIVTLTATDPVTGCKDRITKTLRITSQFQIFIPNAFTPNVDGINDLFSIHTPLMDHFVFHVYDRKGMLVFQTTSPYIEWDGKCRGEELPEGTYLYSLVAYHSLGTVSATKGTIHLIR